MEDEVIKCLTACVMSRKGGVPGHELNADYKELVGENIPIKRLGFESLPEFIRSVPGLRVDAAGTVTAAPSENTRHLQELIKRQKDPVKKQKNYVKNEKKYTNKRYQPYVHPSYQNSQKYLSQQEYHRDQYMARQEHYYRHQYMARQWSSNNQYQPHQQSYYKQRPYKQEPYYESQYEYNYRHMKVEPQYTTNSKYFDTQRSRASKHPKTRFHSHEDPKDLRNVILERSKARMKNNNDWDCNFNNVKTAKCDANNNYFECYTKDAFSKAEEGFYHGYQLIGDDYMLSMTRTKPSPLCASGMTAREATLNVRLNGCAQKVIISIGTAEILEGCSGGELILDMKQLLQTVQNTDAHVVLCTLPPLPNICGWQDAISAVNMYNHWVMSETHGAVAVNLAAQFKSGPSIKFELFENRPRNVPGCNFSIYLWNERGLRAAELEIKRCLRIQ